MKRLLMIMLVLCLLCGCGSSEVTMPSIPDSEPWADLTTPTPPPTPTPTPSPTPEAQTPPPEPQEDQGVEVTGDYINVVLGVWDNSDGSMTYEFKANENLTITSSSGVSDNFTYWFMDVEGQVRLNIFHNGDEDAVEYHFTKNGSTLTLYDVKTGSAVEVLTRRPEATPTPSPTPTPTPAATPKPTETPAPGELSWEELVGVAAPSPEPTTEPEPEPTEDPEESEDAEPSGEPEPEETVQHKPPVTEETQMEEVILPDHAMDAMRAVECVLDCIGGMTFDPADPDLFWPVMARYISRMELQGIAKDLNEGEYMAISGEKILSYAKDVFEEVSELPEPPSDESLVKNEEDTYQIRFGEGGTILDIQGYDEEKDILTAASGGTVYEITISGDSRIQSVTKAD